MMLHWLDQSDFIEFIDPSKSGDHDMEQKCPPKCEQYDFDIDRIMVSLCEQDL